MTEERARVLDLLRQHGWNATSFQVLEEGFSYWFDADDQACVAYVDTGSAWVAAGAPIGVPHRLGAIARGFFEAARAARRRASFFAVEERFLERAALERMPVGEQPSWIPTRWSETVGKSQSLREQLRRARAKGVTVRRLSAEEIADERSPARSAIEALIERWLTSRKMAPMGFLVDVQPFDFPEERRYLLAERAGSVVGVLVAVPVFTRRGWLFEDLLRAPDAPNGTTELLFDAAMKLAATEGSEYVTLGLAPLSGDVSPGLRVARACSRALYDFDGVRRFKAKLGPHAWDPIYIAWQEGGSGTIALYDALAAFTMRPSNRGPARASFTRFGLETLFASPAFAVRALAGLLVPWTILLAIADSATWFPHVAVKIAWVGFDVGLATGLFLLARRWRDGLARGLAVAITLDAVLTIVEAATFNLQRSTSASHVAFVLVACMGPSLAAAFLWGSLRRSRRIAAVFSRSSSAA